MLSAQRPLDRGPQTDELRGFKNHNRREDWTQLGLQVVGPDCADSGMKEDLGLRGNQFNFANALWIVSGQIPNSLTFTRVRRIDTFRKCGNVILIHLMELKVVHIATRVRIVRIDWNFATGANIS
jgi:hypothetical protein